MRPSAQGIFHVKHPKHPQFQFELHTETRKVYIVHLATGVGALLAEGISTKEELILLTNAWINGYEFGNSPGAKPLSLTPRKDN